MSKYLWSHGCRFPRVEIDETCHESGLCFVILHLCELIKSVGTSNQSELFCWGLSSHPRSEHTDGSQIFEICPHGSAALRNATSDSSQKRFGLCFLFSAYLCTKHQQRCVYSSCGRDSKDTDSSFASSRPLRAQTRACFSTFWTLSTIFL